MPNGPRAEPIMRGMTVLRAGALLLLGYAFAAGSGGTAVSLAGGSGAIAERQVGGACPAGGMAEPQPLAFPPLTGRVVDRADLLAQAEEAELEGLLARHERTTTDQVVVVTLATLQGVPIEAYGCRLGNHWGIGQKGADNGVLLIVAPAERAVRIEVGYGLEDELTDARSREILDAEVLPRLRRGEFAGGIRAGVIAILRALGGG